MRKSELIFRKNYLTYSNNVATMIVLLPGGLEMSKEDHLCNHLAQVKVQLTASRQHWRPDGQENHHYPVHWAGKDALHGPVFNDTYDASWPAR